jgi:hypothetical protein
MPSVPGKEMTKDQRWVLLVRMMDTAWVLYSDQMYLLQMEKLMASRTVPKTPAHSAASTEQRSAHEMAQM